MSIADTDVETLLKLKESLESSLLDLAMAGLPVPDDLAREVEEVHIELSRRDPDDIALVLAQKPLRFTDWLGCELGEWTLDQLLEEGRYWFLFHASKLDSAGEAVAGAWIKIARELADYENSDSFPKFSTLTLAISDDLVRLVVPEQNAVVQADIDKLQKNGAGHLRQVSNVNGLLYYVLDEQPGKPMRQLIDYEWAALDAREILPIFAAVVSAAAVHCQVSGESFYGNFKPENILIDDSSASGPIIRFIEPGSYGPLSCVDGLEPEVFITTPEYYPWLDGDDIGALGLCLWEALLGYHPFAPPQKIEQASGWSTSSNMIICSDSLKALVEFENSLANSFVSPLLAIKLPSHLAPVSAQMEAVLLKAIKLRLADDGLLYEDAGYGSLAEFHSALLALQAQESS